MTATDWLGSLASAYPTMQQHARVAFAGMLVFVIAYQLWIAIARRTEPMFYLTAAWAVAALLMVVGRSVQHATPDPGLVLLGARIFHTGVLSMVPLGFAFAHEVRRVPRGRAFWIAVVGTSVPVPLVWLSTFVISDQVQSFQTLTGPILGPVPAAIAPVALPYLAAIAGYLIYVARLSEIPRGQLDWRQRLPGDLAYLLLLPALTNDVLLYSGKLVTVELVNFALFFQVLAINVSIFSRTAELYRGLEETVGLRTDELEERERGLSRALESRRRILEAVPDALCVLAEGRIEYVNTAGERFFERPTRELEGSVFLDHVVPASISDAQRSLADIAASSTSTPVEKWRFLSRSGVERVAEVTGLALELDGVPRTLISVHDVTEREHLLERLQVADRLASVGTLAAGVAHEINNPLTYLSMGLEFIQEALESPDALVEPGALGELRQQVDDCVLGADRIAQIVRDMNTFTRADAAPTAVDCRSTLEYALKVATSTIRHRAVLRLDLGATPPVFGDARRLSQVFLNLLVNAFQSIPDDEGAHEIAISCATASDGWAVVEIADTGTGVAAHMVEKVFDPFVTSRRSAGGTGLGLFICRGIITELGGEIRLQPRRPRGTVARVILPPAPPSAPVNGSPADASVVRTQDAWLDAGRAARPLSVLVADDEPLVLSGLARMLAHHDVIAVGGGEAAIRAMQAKEFDAILCDLMMPGCTGADVWRHARDQGVENRFIMMTGGATTDLLSEFAADPRVRSLPKPVSRSAIETALAAAAAAGRTPARDP